MPKMILPRDDLRSLIRERRRSGAGLFDEVWNGVYVMSPDPDNEHQHIAGHLLAALIQALGHLPGITVYPTINVTNRQEKWRKNYRSPDVSVFLPGNPAEDRRSHWLGGPDFLVEIRSPGDLTRKKFAFYTAVGVREILIVERQPWQLELYHRDGFSWNLVGVSAPGQNPSLASAVLPLTVRLIPGTPRPQIEVARTSDGQRWLA
jgi:Uma2 family endonuclease